MVLILSASVILPHLLTCLGVNLKAGFKKVIETLEPLHYLDKIGTGCPAYRLTQFLIYSF